MTAAVSSSFITAHAGEADFNFAGAASAGAEVKGGEATGTSSGSPLSTNPETAAFFHLLHLFLTPESAATPSNIGTAAEKEFTRGSSSEFAGGNSTRRGVGAGGLNLPGELLSMENARGTSFAGHAQSRRFLNFSRQPGVHERIADAMIRDMLAFAESGQMADSTRGAGHLPLERIGRARFEDSHLDNDKQRSPQNEDAPASYPTPAGTALASLLLKAPAHAEELPPRAISSAGEIGEPILTARQAWRTDEASTIDQKGESRASGGFTRKDEHAAAPFAFGARIVPHALEDRAVAASSVANQRSLAELALTDPALAHPVKIHATGQIADPTERKEQLDQQRRASEDQDRAAYAPPLTAMNTTTDAESSSSAPETVRNARGEVHDVTPHLHRDTSPQPKEIALRVEPPIGQPVDVHLRQRQGEVHVAVRAADPVLAGALQKHLPELVHSLDHAGYRTTTYRGAAEFGLLSGFQPDGLEPELSQPSTGTFSSSEHGSGSEDVAGQRHAREHQDRRQQEHLYMSWEQQTEE